MPSITIKLLLVVAFCNQICLGYQIFIKKLGGKTTVLDVEASDTIYSVKDRMEEKEHVHPKLKTLIFNGKLLQDGRTLADYSIKKHEMIYLVVKSGIEVRASKIKGEKRKRKSLLELLF